ncbi:MAG: hypothetical protein IJY39_05550 [Clostridia bacterium]|nr:hypothetical protein [Clostridia bacterium]
MLRIVDTYSELTSLFQSGFDIDKWKRYLNDCYEGAAELCLNDLKECIDAGIYDYERDILPIINAVPYCDKLDLLHKSFTAATHGLNETIKRCFGREIDADIVLYLGLCNGAGWVTSVNGRKCILLGIEKIVELNWCDIDSMHGLLYHELGHVYQWQYGILECEPPSTRQGFIHQLFTEGIAMYFEQELVGDCDFYHQDRDGWKTWCDEHYERIKTDFYNDLISMTQKDQRFFGDWADYHGKGDVGYYLGCRFVRHLLKHDSFDNVIGYDLGQICSAFEKWYQQIM